MVQFNILAAIIMVSASIPTFAAPVLGDEWSVLANVTQFPDYILRGQ